MCIKMSVKRNDLINSPFNYYRNNVPEDDFFNASKLVGLNNNKDKRINVTVHFANRRTWRSSQIAHTIDWQLNFINESCKEG